MDNRITSTTMLQVLAAAAALTIVGYFAMTYAFARGATMGIEPVYAQSNVAQALDNTQPLLDIATFDDAPRRLYIVQPGDTLSAIVQAQGIDLEELRRINVLHNDTLYPGQVIRLIGVPNDTDLHWVDGIHCYRIVSMAAGNDVYIPFSEIDANRWDRFSVRYKNYVFERCAVGDWDG